MSISSDSDSEFSPIKIDPSKKTKSPLYLSKNTVVIHPKAQKPLPSKPFLPVVIHRIPRPISPSVSFEKYVDRGIMPELFCLKIEESNRKKTVNHAFALILLPESDDLDHTFSDPCIQFNFLEIAKTRLVALKHQKNGNLRQGIEKFQNLLINPNTTPYEDMLIFFGHGNSNSIYFRIDGEIEKGYSVNDVAASDFTGLRPGTVVVSMGCENGKNLIPEISKAYTGPTFGPLDKMSCMASYFHECEKHRRIEFVSLTEETQKQHVQMYVKGKPQSPCESPKTLKKMVAYLTRQSHMGFPMAQYNLSGFYKYGIGVEKSPLKNIKYLIKAAKTDPMAQFELGKFFQLQGDLKKASRYYTQSAAQDFHPAVDALIDLH